MVAGPALGAAARRFPQQGVLVGEHDGEANFKALKAIGADFVYLEASSGASARDSRFADNLGRVRASGLPFGVVHAYDPCIAAERQAANFVTIVPRDDIAAAAGDRARAARRRLRDPVSEAAVESELTTFLNQVEGHVGKPAVLKFAPEFEERYHFAGRIERNLWLERDWLQPAYAGTAVDPVDRQFAAAHRGRATSRCAGWCCSRERGARTLIAARARRQARPMRRYSRLPRRRGAPFADGAVVTGSNVENASYGLSLCAETVRWPRRSRGPARRAGRGGGDRRAAPTSVTPCGRCRQVLHELADLGGIDPLVYCCGPSEVREMRLSELLPAAFGPGSLG